MIIMIMLVFFIGLFLAIWSIPTKDSDTIRGKRYYKKHPIRKIVWKDDEYQ
jgi:hypothetical protein